MAYPIEPAGTDLAAWEKALAGHQRRRRHVGAAWPSSTCGASGSTSSRSILVTDEGENTPPLFVDAARSTART